ncbi:MAG: TIGR00725 family protein [Candidatus Thorarchaeota archaeon]
MVKIQVAVIGFGDLTENPALDGIAEKLGKLLIDNDYRILCGGLGGVMSSICKGAKESSNYKEGMTVGIIPSLDTSLTNPYVDIRIATGMSYSRNQIIIASSDIVISIGGGAGTLSEIAFAWQMNKKVISLSKSGGWSEKLAGKKIDNKRSDIIHEAETEEEVISLISQLLS